MHETDQQLQQQCMQGRKRLRVFLLVAAVGTAARVSGLL
jgi:hypothetical protein